jgi:hypothetical protein
LIQKNATRVGARQEGGRNGEKIEWKSSEVNTRAESECEFKLVVDDVISIRG